MAGRVDQHHGTGSSDLLQKLIAQRVAPLVTDPFSYTEEGHRWVNIPWLFEWGHALLFDTARGLSLPTPAAPGDPATIEKTDLTTSTAWAAAATPATGWFVLSA